MAGGFRCSPRFSTEENAATPGLHSQRKSLFQWQPDAAGLAAGNRLLNESDSRQTVVDVRIERVSAVNRFTADPFHHIVTGGRIDICKSFKECLGMPGRQPAGGTTRCVGIGCKGMTVEYLCGFTKSAQCERVRLFLLPGNGCFFAVDLNPQVIEPPVRHLTDRNHAESIAGKPNKCVPVVIELPSRCKRSQCG